MNIEEVIDYCLTKKGVSETSPFGDDFVVMKVMDRMFLMIALEEPRRITLKCDPERALELRERYHGVEPAWHFNKKYWNQVWLDRDVDDDVVCELIDHSLAEVVKKQTRKWRKAYNELEA